MLDKKMKTALHDIAEALPLVTIPGYDKVQKKMQGRFVKAIMHLKVLPDGSKIKDSHWYMVDTPDSIRRTHYQNLLKIHEANPGLWAPCQDYMDKVKAEDELLKATKHAVTIKVDE